MVRRLIQNQTVRTADHHLGEKTADLFSTGKNLHLFHAVLARKQHSAEEASDIGDIFDGRVAGQPVGDGKVVVEFQCIVLREVCLGGCDTPLIAALIRLQLAHENLEQRCLCKLLAADERDLVLMSHDEGNIVEHLLAVDGL